MTEYVILHPEGDTFELVAAAIDAPKMFPKADAERTVKRLALERALAEMDAEDGITHAVDPYPSITQFVAEVREQAVEVDEAARRNVGSFLGADGVTRTELHHTERKAGPQHVCMCNQAFYDPSAYKLHVRTCQMYRRVVSPPNAEPGAYVHGSAEQTFTLG